MNNLKTSSVIQIILLISILFINCSSKNKLISSSFSKHNKKYLIFIDKSNFTLQVYNKKLQKVANYPIGYGKNPDKKPKMYENDNRTPEGEYLVSEILSMDAAKESSGYRKLSKLNKVFFRARDGHHKHGKPDVDLGRNVYGPRFYAINYPNEEDKQRYEKMLKNEEIKKIKGKVPGIGYGIAIHGNADEASIGFLGSSGCVRMYNNDVIELDKYIQIGTPVIITK